MSANLTDLKCSTCNTARMFSVSSGQYWTAECVNEECVAVALQEDFHPSDIEDILNTAADYVVRTAKAAVDRRLREMTRGSEA